MKVTRLELLHDGSAVHITTVQLPAVNTPQFDWVRSKLPRRAQPVPPIYQPEVAARAIAYAADHPRRREYLIDLSTVLTVTANKIIPGLLDRYLARTGYKSRQTGEARRPSDPANLWRPADEAEGTDRGAHGRFDDKLTRAVRCCGCNSIARRPGRRQRLPRPRRSACSGWSADDGPDQDRRPVVEERDHLLPGRGDVRRQRRRRSRRLPRAHPARRPPGRARGDLRVADAVLPVARPRRRL